MITKYSLFDIYDRIINKLNSEKIAVSSFAMARQQRQNPMNTEQSAKIIDKVVVDAMSPFFLRAEDLEHQLRILNDSVRYTLEGDYKIVAGLLNERLPKRPDHRNSPRPALETTQVIEAEEDLAQASEMVRALANESVDYISYLARIATNSDDYSAKLPITEYAETFAMLENISTMWSLDPTEMKPEFLYCRMLSEVNEQGVPVQLQNATDQKTRVLREVIPVIHAISRFSRASHNPFYRFIHGLPTLLIETAMKSVDAQSSQLLVDVLLELATDTSALATQLRENSEEASRFLSRFHHGHPLYLDMIRLLKRQHTQMMTAGYDLFRRFGVTLKVLVSEYNNLTNLPDAWGTFLTETRLSPVYIAQRSAV